jgi:hypothetical protein
MLLTWGTIGAEILFRPSKFAKGETTGTVGAGAATPALAMDEVDELGFKDAGTEVADQTDVELEAE